MEEFLGAYYTYDSTGLLSIEFCPGYVNNKYYYDDLSQLIRIEDDLHGITYNYSYDADGIRTKKTIGDLVTDYIYIGGQLSALNVDDNMLYFTYDANGGLISVNYDGTEYYYILNPFGDVIALCTADGAVIERYEYDEYGVPVLINNSEIGQLNPFRYRGYIYDEETGFYYLKTRYYDPTIGRFISADGYVSTGQGIIGCNMFAYCGNNPVNYADPSGEYCTAAWEFLKDVYHGIEDAYNAVKTVYVGCGGLAVADGPFPILDAVAGFTATVVTFGVCVAGVYDAVDKKDEAKVKADAIAVTKPSATIIYRYHASKNENLSPRKNKDYDGLSFSTKPPKPGVSAVVTTIEQVNSTGVLIAIRTRGTHVTILPINGSVIQWMNQGQSSIWSQVLSAIVVEWDGGN